MAFDANQVLNPLKDHAMRLGVFDQVNGHEPPRAPGNGLILAIWADAWQPVRQSGLNSVSIRISFHERIYTNMDAQPADEIDPNVLTATSLLMSAYCGNFQLGDDGDDIREIDVFGAAGQPLSAQAGYLTQDGRIFRVMTIAVPVLINDAWTEAP